jgi:hypothetical protein
MLTFGLDFKDVDGSGHANAKNSNFSNTVIFGTSQALGG